MNPLKKFRSRQRDMRTLSSVITASLERSQLEGCANAGAQHLVASALEMDDGTARNVFGRLGISGQDFADAIAAQEQAALEQLGISPGLANSAPPIDGRGTGKFGAADATYEAAIKHTYDLHNENNDYRPLVGAHIIGGVAAVERGTAARAFAALNLDRSQIHDAVRAELN